MGPTMTAPTHDAEGEPRAKPLHAEGPRPWWSPGAVESLVPGPSPLRALGSAALTALGGGSSSTAPSHPWVPPPAPPTGARRRKAARRATKPK